MKYRGKWNNTGKTRKIKKFKNRKKRKNEKMGKEWKIFQKRLNGKNFNEKKIKFG